MVRFLLKWCGKSSLVYWFSLGTKFSCRNKHINFQYVPGLVHKNLVFDNNIAETKGIWNKKKD